MQKLSKKILAEIKQQKIAPRERWIFLAKNYGIWIAAIVGIILAGIFVGNAIHEFTLGEWDISHRFPGGRIQFLLHTLPLLWLLGLAAAATFTFFLLRKTKRGYRFGVLAVSGAIFVVSGIFGVALLSTSLPPKFHELRVKNFPPRFDQQEWQKPADGFLFGEILAIQEKILMLDALDDSIWEIDFAKAKIQPRLELSVGEKIRVIGAKLEDKKFTADFLLAEKPPKIREIMDERKMRMRAY